MYKSRSVVWIFVMAILLSLAFPPIFYAAYLGPDFFEYFTRNVHIKACGVLLYAEGVSYLFLGKYDIGTDLAIKGFAANFVVFSLLLIAGKYVISVIDITGLFSNARRRITKIFPW